jgi:2-polyprenyl-3-methyl-5-hydroxy-6-metoxy-1,4-benzoquinol methylase
MNHSAYHIEWQDARINFLIKKYGEDFFKGKRILELAGFNGRIGAHFAKLGAIVDCVEGREKNVQYMRETYPELHSTAVANLDSVEWHWGKYDIIINFGLYYHLEHYHKEHLLNCIQHCDLMFFETVIYDSPDAELYFAGEQGSDQSLSNRAGTPSTSFVENIFKEASVNYTIHKDRSLNGGYHTYDWTDTFTRNYHHATRRFWVVQK